MLKCPICNSELKDYQVVDWDCENNLEIYECTCGNDIDSDCNVVQEY